MQSLMTPPQTFVIQLKMSECLNSVFFIVLKNLPEGELN